MKIVSVSFGLICGCSMAYAMESPFGRRSEIDASPAAFSETNSGASGLSAANRSPIDSSDKSKKIDELESPPHLALNCQIKTEEDLPEKEHLLDMAELGVQSYKGSGPDSTATFYFETILKQKPEKKIENPKAVALAELYSGKMFFKGELDLCPGHPAQGFHIAHDYLKNAAMQRVDLKVAAQALLTLTRVYYAQGMREQNPMQKNMLLHAAVRSAQQVVHEALDEESALTAKLVLSDAAQTGNGMKRDLNVALQYAHDVANQQKYPRESLKGCLQSAMMHMEGIDADNWNVQNAGYAELYLTRPRQQTQFEDLRNKAEGLCERLKAKLQECRYQEGLAYIRRALPVNGYHGARSCWDALGKKNIKALSELKKMYPNDYAYVLNQAEHHLEQAAYENYNPEIKVAAREKLGLIYKETGRPNKFQEIEKAMQRARQADGNLLKEYADRIIIDE